MSSFLVILQPLIAIMHHVVLYRVCTCLCPKTASVFSLRALTFDFRPFYLTPSRTHTLMYYLALALKILADVLHGIHTDVPCGIYSDMFISPFIWHFLSTIYQNMFWRIIIFGILSGIYSDILSYICSDILFDICSEILLDILFAILSGNLFGSHGDTFFHIQFGIPIWRNFWHFIWHSIWPIRHFIQQPYWHSIWHVRRARHRVPARGGPGKAGKLAL